MTRLATQFVGIGLAIAVLAFIAALLNPQGSASWVMSVLSVGLGLLMVLAGASLALLSHRYSQQQRCEPFCDEGAQHDLDH